jgi:hypothetical protein
VLIITHGWQVFNVGPRLREHVLLPLLLRRFVVKTLKGWIFDLSCCELTIVYSTSVFFFTRYTDTPPPPPPPPLRSMLVVSLVSSASQLTCGEVKSLYNEAQCCGSDPSEPAKTTTSFCYPVRDFGYPKCYATFLDLSKQYADDTQWAYLPSEEGYSYHPYSGAELSDCINIPRAVLHTVPHSSPLGTAILSVEKDPTLPVRLNGQLAISLTGSWNRANGTETGYQWDVVKLQVDVSTGNVVSSEGSILLNSGPVLYTEYGVVAVTKKYRPSDIHQAFGRTFAATKQNKAAAPADQVFNGVFHMRFENGTAVQGESLPLPCARRLASSAKYLFVSYASCPGLSAWNVSGSGVYAIDPYNLTTVRMVAGGLHELDGIDVHGGDLYIATSGQSIDNKGNSLLKLPSVDEIADALFAAPRDDAASNNTSVEVVKTFGYRQSWHAASALAITPDGKYALMSKAAACNIGCEGVIVAIELAEPHRVFKYAGGLRNPTGLEIYVSDMYVGLIVSDMASDLGLGTTDLNNGQEGPNDRILQMALYEPKEEYSVACRDDRHGIVAASSTTCATLISDVGCDGKWLWPEFQRFGDFAKLPVAQLCEASCGECS